MDPFQIPDYLSPIVAYRTWQWDAEGLKSLNNDLWIPGEAKKATCKVIAPCTRKAWQWDEAAGEWVTCSHEAPVDGCSCGVYAAKSYEHLASIGYLGQGPHGEVHLWGRVWDHRLGYRAQYAYPKNIIIPQDMIPFKMQDMESRLMSLTAYNVDLFIQCQQLHYPLPDCPIVSADVEDRNFSPGQPGNLLLWSKATGNYEPDAVDWLLSERKKWYTYRAEEVALKVGDRVSVLGVGIGLVLAISRETPSIADKVCIRMFNADLKVPYNSVVWNDRNFRWETNGRGYSTSV